MSGQDWTPVVLVKRKTAEGKAEAARKAVRDGAVVLENKFMAGTNKSAHSAAGTDLRKLDEAEEVVAVPHVSHDMSMAIQKARTDKKMTQKQLAQLINEKPTVVNDYESGRATPSPAIITKLERALGVRLPRGSKK